MTDNNSNNDGGSSSYFDGGFDYRSLLPTHTTPNQRFGSFSDDDESGCCYGIMPTLTFRERVIGCVTCMIGGYILSLGSWWRIVGLLRGNPIPFVMNTTIGNIIALMGSCFLSGPTGQYTKMFHEKRYTATVLYLGSLFVTLLVIFIPIRDGPKGLLLLLLIIIQYIAVAWYCLSYIPFAHDAVKSYIAYCWARSSGGGGSMLNDY